MRLMRMRYQSVCSAVALVCMICQLVTGGCASIDQRVETLASKGDFDAALAELEAAGVGRTVVVKPEPTPEALQAREIYRTSIEAFTSKEVTAALGLGLARQAGERASRGQIRCPWSEELQALERQSLERIAAIDAAQVQLEYVGSEAGSRVLRRESLRELQPLAAMLRDSPAVVASARKIRELLCQDALASISPSNVPSREIRTQLAEDLALAEIERAAVDSSVSALEALEGVVESQSLEGDSLERLVQGMQATSKVPALAPIVECLAGNIERWARTRSEQPVSASDVSVRVLTAIHSLKLALPVSASGSCRQLLVAALVSRSEPLIVDPQCAPLAWVYLEAARALLKDDSALQSKLDAVANSLRASDTYRATIAIDLGPKIEPIAHPLLFMALYEAIAQSTRPGVAWEWVDPVHGRATIRLEVSEGTIHSARFDDLTEKTSRYLSHHESVPNPRKAFLESRLNSLKFAIGMAESGFQSAVSSHNIYPTEWSLMSVNSARTRYVMAVDQYNATVREYNMTPDTVSEPVYLPYTYREGTVRSGLSTSGQVHVGESARQVRHAEVVSDNVRVGTKFNDSNDSSRRDDGIDIDVSGEAQLRRIMTVAERWVKEVSIAVSELPVPTRRSLPDDEQAVLAWLSGPFGPQDEVARRLALPKWLVDPGLRFEYPSRDMDWSPINLAQAPAAGSDAQLRQTALEASCEVLISSTSGVPTSRGSGALVSADGLILTCAHVLTGPRISVKFIEGALAGEYDAEVVRINDRTDVALLRAVGLRAATWLGVQREPIERGLAVYAIGSPSVGPAAVAHAALTKGEIVSPIAEDWGYARVVAEVAIATGSSGGPLIDAKSGQIVGIITAVSGPQFSEERASTASFCLAAPAVMLPDWLGVTVDGAGGGKVP